MHVGEERVMKVRVDEDTCTGCGLCADACPEVLVLHERGVAVVLVETVPVDHESQAQEAAEGCPVEAISIEDD